MLVFIAPLACPMGHGKLRGYTIGSRLIVEAVLILFWVATYFAASLLNFGPSTTGAVFGLLVLVLATLVILDFSVLKYRCSTCGLTFTRRELATRPGHTSHRERERLSNFRLAIDRVMHTDSQDLPVSVNNWRHPVPRSASGGPPDNGIVATTNPHFRSDDMLANDSNEQKQQGGFSLLVNAGRGVAELMMECRKCRAITRYGLELAWRLQTLACPECTTAMRLTESELTTLREGLIEARVRIDRLIPARTK